MRLALVAGVAVVADHYGDCCLVQLLVLIPGVLESCWVKKLCVTSHSNVNIA